MNQKLMTDPVIDEIHRIRREMSDKFGGDLAAMVEDARQRQATSGRPIWKPKTTNSLTQPLNDDTVSGSGMPSPATD